MDEDQHSGPAKGGALVASVCVAGPGLVSLIPMAAAPAMPAIAHRFAQTGDGTLFAQMIMTLPAVMLIISAPLAGMAAERWGRRPVLLFALALYLVGGAGALFVPDAGSLVAARLVLGFAGGALLTSCLTLISDHFEGAAREKVLGFATSLSSLVAVAALMLGGRLVDAFGWRGSFGLYVLSVPVFLLALFVIKPAGVIVAARKERVHWAPLLNLWPYYALLVALTIGMFMPSVQVAFLLVANGVKSAALQGTIVAACSFVAMLSAGSYGWLRQAFNARAMLTLTALSFGLGALLVSASTDPMIIAAGCAVIGIGAGLTEPAIASVILSRSPDAIHARAMGMMVSALFLGQFLNPLVVNPLRQGLGIRGAFFAVGAALSLVGVTVFILRGRVLSGVARTSATAARS